MLRTKRLLLRRAKMSDVSDVHAFMADPAAMAYWDTPPHADTATTRKLVRGLSRNKSVAHYYVFEMDGHVIGMGGLHSKNEIGYMLHPAHWRKGLMREAFDVLLPHVWTVTDVATLRVEIDPRNAASLAFAKSLGFTETGRKDKTHHIDGVWSDSVYLALERPDDL